jgi:thiol-disulfide isomerase/thioredoxin
MSAGPSRRQVIALAGAGLALPYWAGSRALASEKAEDIARRAGLAAEAAADVAARFWPETDDHGDRIAPPAARLKRLSVPRALPELTLAPLLPTGKAPKLMGTNGILLHFWAPWCAPCIRELPLVVAGCKAAGVTAVTVSTDTRVYAVLRFCTRLKIPPEEVFLQKRIEDPEDLLLGGILPATLVVDADGLVRARAIGEVDWRTPESWQVVMEWCG